MADPEPQAKKTSKSGDPGLDSTSAQEVYKKLVPGSSRPHGYTSYPLLRWLGQTNDEEPWNPIN